MNATKNVSAVLAALGLSLILFSCVKQEESVESPNGSEFLDGTDQWKIEGDAQGGETLDPFYSPIEGLDNSGYVYATDDVTGGVWYFVAPSKFRGNKSAYFNGTMEFWLIQKSALSNQFYDDDIIIEGGANGKLIYSHSSYPGTSWTFYQIVLNSSDNWLDENGNKATDAKIQSVLSGISKLSIRGEFETGSDTGGLDSFAFEAQ
ncbi:MAG: laminin B domain-containing protein [Leadbetterella sp.]|nr:laminin B domain-containing protein [Leadbetterella sp.]